MNNSLVSVIIPNYNHAKYLDQRIQSVLSQTYQNFEVIILDDKSTDNSCEVIEKYRGNSHVSHIVYNSENSGSTFRQWHKGFELAKGELIWIAESDDACEITMLEQLVSCFSDDVVLAYVSSKYMDSAGQLNSACVSSTNDIFAFKGCDYIKEKLYAWNSIQNASSVLFKRSIAVSLPHDYMSFKASGDYLFWVYMSERGDVVWIDRCLNYFRKHDNEVSPKRLRDGCTFFEDALVYKYLVHNGYLSIRQRIQARSWYMERIDKVSFLTEDIRQKVQKCWNPFPIPYRCSQLILGKILYWFNYCNK